MIVGKTGCGKTYFVQKLGLHNFFGKIVKVEWVSFVQLSKSREAEIQSCFNSRAEFHHAQDVEDLKALIEAFKLRTDNLVENDSVNISVHGENKVMDRLIFMDNISGLADCCKEFAILNYNSKISLPLPLIPDKEVWKKIISQKKIFNIFPSSVPFHTVSKILESILEGIQYACNHEICPCSFDVDK